MIRESCANDEGNERQERGPRLRIKHLWLGLPVFLLICKASVFPLPLLDFWWHLKMGEVIASTGSIPRTDIFSFTAAGQPFIIHNWLAEVIYYGVYRTGGFPLLIGFNVLLLVAALLPVCYLCRKATVELWIAVASAGLAAFGMFCNMRPQVFSFVLFSLFLWALADYRDRRRDWLWALPPLMALWVNLHGAFVVGLGLMALILVCETTRSLMTRAGSNRLSKLQLAKLGIVLLLCAIATLANPEGYSVYTYISTVLHDPSSQLFVIEWQPPRIDTIQGALLFYLPFFLSIVILIYAKEAPNLTDLALFLCFAAFGLTATRNSIWFLLVNSPLVARFLTSTGWPKSLPILRRGRRGTVSYEWLNYLILGMATVIIIMFSPWLQPRLFQTSLLEAKTPVAAVDYIEKSSMEGNIFHPQIYGDYLIWRLWPRHRAYFDGRVHLYGEGFVRNYQRIFRDTHWEELLEKQNIRHLLLDKDGDARWGSERLIKEARESGRWRLLYEDELSALLEKVRIED